MVKNGYEEIKDKNGVLIAFVIFNSFQGEKYNFPTPEDSPLQVGINFYKEGDSVKAHFHNAHKRVIEKTQEFVLVANGQVKFTVYSEENEVLREIELVTGEVIFFASGGHRWDFIGDTKIIEVKQGPYVSVEKDKTLID